MRVVFTFPFCLGSSGGGPLHCEQLASHMRAQGCDVTILPIAAPWGKWGARKETAISSRETRLREKCVEVIRVRPHPFHYALDSLELRKQIKTVASRESIDAVLSWWTEAAFLPGFLRRLGIFFAMMAAGSYTDRITFRPTRLQILMDSFLLWRPLRKADVIYANSKFTRREVATIAGAAEDRIQVTYCGIEPSFREVPRVYSGVPKRFIYFGHMTGPKGLGHTLDALGRLKRSGVNDWTLRIAGWGVEDRVRRTAEVYGIADQIEILGPVSRAQLMTELEWAQLAILPSQVDSFGLVTAEAQAAGLPVIGYDVGGIPEVVDSGNTGWLVPLGRVDLIADAIAEAINNPEETFKRGIAGRKVTERFSWDRVASAILTNIDAQLSRLRAKKTSLLH